VIVDVFFSYHVFDLQEYGGISRYCTELHKGLLRKEVHSRVIAGVHINEYLAGEESVWGAKACKLVGTNTARRRLNRFIDERMRRRLPERAIYHLTFHDGVPLPRHARLAFTVHDLIRERVAGGDVFADDLSVHKRYLSELADVVFAVSHNTKRDLVDIFDIPPEKVFVTPLGSSFTHLADVPPTEELGEYVLYVGARQGLRNYKNFGRMVRALAVSRAGKELNLVCFGGGEFTPKECELLSATGLTDCTHLLSGSDRRLASLLAGAMCLIYPSLYEGFGLPSLEAMTMGCPVACSDRSSIPEVAGEAALYFDPEDIDSMQHAIDRLCYDSQLRASLKKAGRARSRKFTWQATVEATLRGYRYAAGRGASW
jgi:glycosyltransferase involved in cell wall biosynthesis